jgi:hypothetical protein
MISYTVVYQFLCPNCKCIMVGSNEIKAEQLLDACVQFSSRTLPCRVCHQTVKTQALVKFLIHLTQPSDLAGSEISPAVPLT